jgi:hypothetical protein
MHAFLTILRIMSSAIANTCMSAGWPLAISGAARLVGPADPSLVHRPCQSRGSRQDCNCIWQVFRRLGRSAGPLRDSIPASACGTAVIIALAKSPLLSACAIAPSLNCKLVGSWPYAALSKKTTSEAGRASSPARVLRRSGTPASDTPFGVQQSPSPPGSSVKRNTCTRPRA